MTAGRLSESGATVASRWHGPSVALLLVIHAGLLAWSAWDHSPAIDEIAHLPAGVSHWHFDSLELYPVNSPFVKTLAAAPVVWFGCKTDWRDYDRAPTQRSEFQVGHRFVWMNRAHIRTLYFLARLALLPFSLCGAFICYLWSRALFGRSGGLLTLALWCFSPNILANAAMITPDVPAAAMAVTASYVFWRSKRRKRDSQQFPKQSPETNGQALVVKQSLFSQLATAACSWTLLGLAILCKFTNVVLIPVWLLSELMLGRAVGGGAGTRITVRCGAVVVGSLSLVCTLNAGYGFRQLGRPLGEFEFVSSALSGRPVESTRESPANRFRGGMWAKWPVPVSATMLRGIDLQRRDFEIGMWSYLAGEQRLGGWWYYYLVCLLLKVPLGTWLVFLIAIGVGKRPAREARWILWCSGLAILAFVSSQTGFSRYFRYLLPAFPFLFIACGAAATAISRRQRWYRLAVGWGVLCSIGASLLVAPHWMSYFNSLAGGPGGGARYLIDANIDWGQDLYRLQRWYREHPEAADLRVVVHSLVDIRGFGLPGQPPPMDPRAEGAERVALRQLGPQPGWFAVSVHEMRNHHGRYQYFQQLEPVARIGHSILIFHLGAGQAAELREQIRHTLGEQGRTWMESIE